MPELGTLEWLDAGGGKMAWRDRFASLWQAIRAKAAENRDMRDRREFRHADLDSLLPPDTAVAKAALAWCAADSEPFLLNHCLRSYLWARLIDSHRGGTSANYDDEAFYVAMMLHDMGLAAKHRLADDDARCFTTVGAEKAGELASQHGWSDQRTHLVSQAIALHLNVEIHDKYGKEAFLLRLGSGADVGGFGLGRMPAPTVDAVVGRHPRLDFKTEIQTSLKNEAQRCSAGRMAFALGYLGFRRYIQGAPMFSE